MAKASGMHVIKHPKKEVKRMAGGARRVGTSGTVQLQVDPALGDQGQQLAQQLFSQVGAVADQVAAYFPGVTVPSSTLVIAKLSDASDGTGGAYHSTCADTALYCDASYSDQGKRTLALYVAELVECYEAQGNKGWDCGQSPGEGLSRVLAQDAYPGSLDDYSTASAWLDGDRADWISQAQPSDTDPASTGCAVLFLNWLHTVKGHSWQDISAAGGATLADTYQALGEQGDPLQSFMDAVEANWPAGKPSGVSTDNPWSNAPPPPPPPPQQTGLAPTLQALDDNGDQVGVYLLVPTGAANLRQLGPLSGLLAALIQALLTWAAGQAGGSPAPGAKKGEKPRR